MLIDMDATSASPITIERNPAVAAYSRGLSILLMHRGDDARQMLQAAAQYACGNGSDAELITALRGEQVVGAALVRKQPGQVAQVWTPRLVDHEPADTAVKLLTAAACAAGQWRCSLVQAVLEPKYDIEYSALEGAGFERIADLLFLVSWLQEAPAELPPWSFELVTYRGQDRARQAAVIEATYDGTLDCPRLNGVRRAEDVVAGHESNGVFDPNNWFFVRLGGQDIGCLLLAEHGNGENWELVYVGLTPAARGRGYGLQLIQSAQSMARRKGASQLLLAVDAANAPAVASYLAAGFVVWDRRPVYLKILTSC